MMILFLFCLCQAFAASCGDVNDSGDIDIMDALRIAQLCVGLISESGLTCSTSDTPASTPDESLSIAIACGSSSAVGSFPVDQYFSGGSTDNIK